MPTADAVDVIYSRFQDDEDFRELLEDFYTSAQTHKMSLRESFVTGAVSDVRAQAHQLKGIGGGYGFNELSVLASHLEDACLQPAPQLNDIAPLLDDVIDYLSRIRI